MPFAEEDLLPISALQHLLFCARQAALIHVERLWAENSLTRLGRHLHEKADAGRGETRRRRQAAGDKTADTIGVTNPLAAGIEAGGRVRIARGLMLRSLRLGLFGKADIVEFRGGVPFPVEYKRGKPKKNRCDEVQLCAQALCLEEMLGVAVPAGAIFYGVTRRRIDVAFDPTLRELTERLIGELREIVDEGRTPPAAWEKKCERCSLIHLCLPECHPGTDAAGRYLKRVIGQALVSGAGPVGE